MVYSPGISCPRHLHPRINVSRHFLHMERGNIQGPSFQRHKTGGGWELVDVAANCRALRLTRMCLQGTREGIASDSWLQAWGLIGNLANPPRASRYPIKLAYLRAHVNFMAYATPTGQEESTKHFRRRVYTSLHTMEIAASTIRDIRVVTMHPTLNWPQITTSGVWGGGGRHRVNEKYLTVINFWRICGVQMLDRMEICLRVSRTSYIFIYFGIQANLRVV